MPTECSAKSFGFERAESRDVVALFDGGAITNDAGNLLLGATDPAIGLLDRLVECFSDRQRADLIEHGVGTLVSQRVFRDSAGL